MFMLFLVEVIEILLESKVLGELAEILRISVLNYFWLIE